MSSATTMTTAVGLSKVFILEKYFSELQKFWETEKRLKGKEKEKKRNKKRKKEMKFENKIR